MAEECTDKVRQIGQSNLFVQEIYWKASATATFTDAVLTCPINGRIICVDTKPGATAPDLNYDPSLVNAHGIDIMEGDLVNRHNVNAERAWPLIGGNEPNPVEPPVEGCLTLGISGITNVNCDGYLYVYFKRDAGVLG